MVHPAAGDRGFGSAVASGSRNACFQVWCQKAPAVDASCAKCTAFARNPLLGQEGAIGYGLAAGEGTPRASLRNGVLVCNRTPAPCRLKVKAARPEFLAWSICPNHLGRASQTLPPGEPQS